MVGDKLFQSAPPAREATHLETGSDGADRCFNPRLPRGRRLAGAGDRIAGGLFQSAPPAREATWGRDELTELLEVSIRASRAGGDQGFRDLLTGGSVSIRASRAGGDCAALGAARSEGVSIRASRAGGDELDVVREAMGTSFNPRLPRGRRQETPEGLKICTKFQSAPPAREATVPFTVEAYPVRQVSIRASRAGGDAPKISCRQGTAVSIRASRAGGDELPRISAVARGVSIRASRAGGDSTPTETDP